MTLRIVVFDVDGTLINSVSVISHCLSTALVGFGCPAPTQLEVREIIGISLPEAVGRLAPEASPNVQKNIVEKYREEFSRVHAQEGFTEQFFPGAMACLKGLSDSGYLLAVATGKSRKGLNDLLAQHDLGKYFVALGTADDGPGKPHPYMLQKVLSESGVESSEAIMIGDTTYDIEMARSARVCSVGVSWGNHTVMELRKAGANHIVDSFEEFEQWVYANFPIL